MKLRVTKARLRRDGLTDELSGLLVRDAALPLHNLIHPLQWYVDELNVRAEAVHPSLGSVGIACVIRPLAYSATRSFRLPRHAHCRFLRYRGDAAVRSAMSAVHRFHWSGLQTEEERCELG